MERKCQAELSLEEHGTSYPIRSSNSAEEHGRPDILMQPRQLRQGRRGAAGRRRGLRHVVEPDELPDLRRRQVRVVHRGNCKKENREGSVGLNKLVEGDRPMLCSVTLIQE